MRSGKKGACVEIKASLQGTGTDTPLARGKHMSQKNRLMGGGGKPGGEKGTRGAENRAGHDIGALGCSQDGSARKGGHVAWLINGR